MSSAKLDGSFFGLRTRVLITVRTVYKMEASCGQILLTTEPRALWTLIIKPRIQCLHGFDLGPPKKPSLPLKNISKRRFCRRPQKFAWNWDRSFVTHCSDHMGSSFGVPRFNNSKSPRLTGDSEHQSPDSVLPPCYQPLACLSCQGVFYERMYFWGVNPDSEHAGGTQPTWGAGEEWVGSSWTNLDELSCLMQAGGA